MTPLRIAFLDSWYRGPAEGSGTAAAIGGLERALLDRGHRVHRLGPAGGTRGGRTWSRLRFNLALPGVIDPTAYDLVVGFDLDGFRLAGRWAHPRYVCSVKGVMAEEARQERGGTRLLLGLLARLEGRNVRRAPRVVTTSRYCRDQLVRHYRVDPARVRLVPEGVDVAGFARQAAEGAAMGRDPRGILCVARQYPRKRVADLLRAVRLLRDRSVEARLVVIGDGPEHVRLRALAERLGLGGVARLIGAVPDDAEVARWYGRCGLFCLPSGQEGFGIVFLEAMAAGLPVVATTAAAIPEVVPHGVAGLLVPPGDVPALAEALAAVLADPDRAARLGSAGRRVAASFDWDRVAEHFLDAVVGPG